jgi:ribosomal-protein-alanine N-acetyltransferase
VSATSRRLAAAWQSVPETYRGWTVGSARLVDAPRIAALEREVFPEPMSLRQVLAALLQPDTCYLVVRDGRTIAAYFGFTACGPYAHVLANVTHPAYRRRGLARFVLTAAEPLARALGCRAFLGEVRVSNDAQQQVLEQIGWRTLTVLPRCFANGEDARIVFRPL